MEWYKNYVLSEEGEGFILEIQLNMESTEFSKELMDNFQEGLFKFDNKINELIEEKFSEVKVNSVKLLVGTLLVATVPFIQGAPVQAAEVGNSTNTMAVAYTTTATTGIVTANKLNVRTGPSTSDSVMHVLWQGNKINVVSESGTWYKILLSDGRSGWVSKTYVQVDLRQQEISKVIATAEGLIGTPYVWGGTSLAQGGFDCSGFTQYVFKQQSIDLKRVSIDQSKEGTLVSKENLQPGDLVFFSFSGNGVVNHVGLYLGNGKMIHSPKTGDAVKVTDITTSYWQNIFVTARRII